MIFDAYNAVDLIAEAEVLLAEDRAHDAHTAAEAAIELDRDNPNAWDVFGRILQALDRPQGAMTAQQMVAKLDPKRRYTIEVTPPAAQTPAVPKPAVQPPVSTAPTTLPPSIAIEPAPTPSQDVSAAPSEPPAVGSVGHEPAAQPNSRPAPMPITAATSRRPVELPTDPAAATVAQIHRAVGEIRQQLQDLSTLIASLPSPTPGTATPPPPANVAPTPAPVPSAGVEVCRATVDESSVQAQIDALSADRNRLQQLCGTSSAQEIVGMVRRLQAEVDELSRT